MKILVLDANSLINRAFYAIRLLSTRAGEYTNAVYGFLSTYFKLLEEERPDGVCACFDLKAPTFRHMEFADYKAGRRPMPAELIPQFDLCKSLLDALGASRLEVPGYEADDLLGTLSRLCEESAGDAPWNCLIVTGDRDSLQLAGARTTVRLITTRQGKPHSADYTPETLLAEYGLTPAQLIEVKALMGDTSDNIPGVAGVGEKTALDLIRQFGTVEALYNGLDSAGLRPVLRQKLEAGRDAAFMSRRLAEIDRRAPVAFTPAQALLRPPDHAALMALLQRLELRSFIAKLKQAEPVSARPSADFPATESSSGDLSTIEAINIEASNTEASTSAPSAKEEPDTPAPAGVCRLITDPGLLPGLLPEDGAPVSLLAQPAQQWAALATPRGAYLVRSGDVGREAFQAFLTRLMGPGYPKRTHDAKPLLLDLLEEGIAFDRLVSDSAVAAYLLDPTAGDYSLPAVALRHLGTELPPLDEATLASPLSDGEDSALVCGAWLRALEALCPLLEKQLDELAMRRLYDDVELPLCQVLASMQHLGVRVDRERLSAYSAQLHARLRELETEIQGISGQEINLNSPKQLGELLFERLRLPGGRKTKTGYSTDIDALNRLRGTHPIIEPLIEYRQLAKLQGTYADGLVRYISPRDGRIHSNFRQLVTATGRLSSTDPNLQNIPVRQALGAELRHMFVPENNDWLLVDADYSQIELRLLAHIAQDRAMLTAFAAGADIHRATAASVAGVSPDEVTPDMRSRAKAVNFGIVYGISEYSLAGNLGISRAEAKAYIESYFNTYPGVRAYMERIKAQAAADGYVTTLFGRRRALPELASTNRNIRSFGERVALNAPIQGSAADIMKIAMVGVYRRLLREGRRARLILQVHDELIVEAPREEASAVAALVTEEMEAAAHLDVALVAEASVGADWYAAKG